MGTSKAYSGPTTPQWRDLKSAITRAADTERLNRATIGKLLKLFVAANGGTVSMAHGQGSLGRQKNGQETARRLGTFAHSVAVNGFWGAVEATGLQQPSIRSISEVAAYLTNYLGGAATTIDDVDARQALARLIWEVLFVEGGVDDAALELKFTEGLADLMLLYFAFYLFEQFCRVAYDRLVKKEGAAKANADLDDILEYIKQRVRQESITRDLGSIDWHGPTGDTLAQQIFEEVLMIFGEEE